MLVKKSFPMGKQQASEVAALTKLRALGEILPIKRAQTHYARLMLTLGFFDLV